MRTWRSLITKCAWRKTCLHTWRRQCFTSVCSNIPSDQNLCTIHVKNELGWSLYYPPASRRLRLLGEILTTRSLDILSSLRKWKPVLGSHSSSHGLAHVDRISSTAWIKVALKHSSLSTPEGSLLTFQAPADACVHAQVWLRLPSSYLGTWPDISKVNGCRHRSVVTHVFLENSLNKDLSPVLLFLFCCCDLHYWFFFLYRKNYC